MSQGEKRNYHHGDLRSALVQAGLKLLEESHGVGLREVARAVGVSATAVYRHFPDKAALLRALATEGLDRLAASQQDSFESAGGGKDGFAATGHAYVRFALDNPALFRLIFANPPAPDAAAGFDREAPEAFRMLLANAALLAPPDADQGALRLIALGAWAQVHGLAMLMLDGQIPRDPKLVETLVGPGPAGPRDC